MDQLLIALSDKNVKKLLKHLPVQLKHEQIGRGMRVHPDMPARHQKALKKAMRLRKGVRLQFLPDELVEGSGFWDWLKGAAETVYNTVAKPFVNVVKSSYRPIMEVARPLVKQYAPEIAKVASTYTGLPISTEQVLGAEKLSKDILGVGMQRRVGRGLKTNKTRAVSDMSGILDTSSNLLSPQHPIFQTSQQMPPQDMYGAMQQMQKGSGIVVPTSAKDYLALQGEILSKPNYTYGGSFKSAGYGKSPRGIRPYGVGGSFLPAGYRRGGRVKFLK